MKFLRFLLGILVPALVGANLVLGIDALIDGDWQWGLVSLGLAAALLWSEIRHRRRVVR